MEPCQTVGAAGTGSEGNREQSPSSLHPMEHKGRMPGRGRGSVFLEVKPREQGAASDQGGGGGVWWWILIAFAMSPSPLQA